MQQSSVSDLQVGSPSSQAWLSVAELRVWSAAIGPEALRRTFNCAVKATDEPELLASFQFKSNENLLADTNKHIAQADVLVSGMVHFRDAAPASATGISTPVTIPLLSTC